jgi:large subunit ribosomal protein L20
MPRSTSAPAVRQRRNKILKRAKGYFGNKSRLPHYAEEAVIRAGQNSYRDRRRKKADFRQLWIVRLNAACRAQGITYSRFISGLKAANIEMNRKVLSELAVNDAEAFAKIVQLAREALTAAPAPR